MKRFGREIALLTLPVLVFGGLAWWKTRGGSMAQLQGAPSDIYSGKPRLEIGEIKPLEMTPWDVAQGLVWGIDATVWQGGQSPVAPGVRRATTFMGAFEADVFYRQGTRWMKARRSSEGFPVISSSEQKEFGDFAVRRDLKLKVRLGGVPRDADEVRLKGHFFYENDYQSGGCRGVAGGQGWRMFPKTGVCYFTTQSKPFDIPIVKAQSAWPKPVVSRETPFELVDAKCIANTNFVMRLRHNDGKDWEVGWLSADKVQLLDADMRPVELVSGSGTKAYIHGFGTSGQNLLNSKRAKKEMFFSIIPGYARVSVDSWSDVKFPLTLRAEISDGTCWPLKIDTKVARVQMETEDFGAAK